MLKNIKDTKLFCVFFLVSNKKECHFELDPGFPSFQITRSYRIPE